MVDDFYEGAINVDLPAQATFKTEGGYCRSWSIAENARHQQCGNTASATTGSTCAARVHRLEFSNEKGNGTREQEIVPREVMVRHTSLPLFRSRARTANVHSFPPSFVFFPLEAFLQSIFLPLFSLLLFVLLFHK